MLVELRRQRCRPPPVHFRLERSTVSKSLVLRFQRNSSPQRAHNLLRVHCREPKDVRTCHVTVKVRELLRKALVRVISLGQRSTGHLPSRISRLRKQAPWCAWHHPGLPSPITQTAVPVTARPTLQEPVSSHTQKKKAWRRVSDTSPSTHHALHAP